MPRHRGLCRPGACNRGWFAARLYTADPDHIAGGKLRLIRIFNTSRAVPLMHQAQGRTAKLHGQFGLLLVVGWTLSLALPPA